MLYKVVLIFESVNEILKRDQHDSNENDWAVLSCVDFYYAVQGGSNFELVDEILKFSHLKEGYWAMLSFATVCFPRRNLRKFAKF